MKTAAVLLTIFIGCSPVAVRARVPVTPNPDHEAMLQNWDPAVKPAAPPRR